MLKSLKSDVKNYIIEEQYDKSLVVDLGSLMTIYMLLLSTGLSIKHALGSILILGITVVLLNLTSELFIKKQGGLLSILNISLMSGIFVSLVLEVVAERNRLGLIGELHGNENLMWLSVVFLILIWLMYLVFGYKLKGSLEVKHNGLSKEDIDDLGVLDEEFSGMNILISLSVLVTLTYWYNFNLMLMLMMAIMLSLTYYVVGYVQNEDDLGLNNKGYLKPNIVISALSLVGLGFLVISQGFAKVIPSNTLEISNFIYLIAPMMMLLYVGLINLGHED